MTAPASTGKLNANKKLVTKIDQQYKGIENNDMFPGLLKIIVIIKFIEEINDEKPARCKAKNAISTPGVE